MARERHSQDALSKMAKVSQKTVSNMLKPEGPTPHLDNIDAVAAVYGLTGWQLILPSLPASKESVEGMVRLVENFAGASAEGQAAITRVAEMEANYGARKPK